MNLPLDICGCSLNLLPGGCLCPWTPCRTRIRPPASIIGSRLARPARFCFPFAAYTVCISNASMLSLCLTSTSLRRMWSAHTNALIIPALIAYRPTFSLTCLVGIFDYGRWLVSFVYRASACLHMQNATIPSIYPSHSGILSKHMHIIIVKLFTPSGGATAVTKLQVILPQREP